MHTHVRGISELTVPVLLDIVMVSDVVACVVRLTVVVLTFVDSGLTKWRSRGRVCGSGGGDLSGPLPRVSVTLRVWTGGPRQKLD